MRTDDLITALAADLETKPTPVNRAVALALAASAPVSLAILLLFVHVRPGFAGMMGEPKVIIKFIFTFGLFTSGLWLALRLSRPGTGAGPARYALLGVIAILLAAVAVEMITMPSAVWASAMIGSYAIPCLQLIAVFSAAPLAAIIVALRTGAPDNPTLAGASGGLLAGGLGATIYATHCVEDSALFLSVWYVLGICAVTIAGAAIGRTALRW